MAQESSNAHLAPVKWAQRSDSLYVTIDLPDVTGETVNLTGDKIEFRGTSNGQEFYLDAELFSGVVPEESKWNVHPRNIQMYIHKADTDAEFWPRLLKNKQLEKTNVSCDWARYVDDDEEEEKGGFDMSGVDGGQGFDPAMMQQMMAGMGGGPGGGPGGAGGLDMSALSGMMGGMGGGADGGMAGMMGGEGGDSDDEDDLPDLEEDA